MILWASTGQPWGRAPRRAGVRPRSNPIILGYADDMSIHQVSALFALLSLGALILGILALLVALTTGSKVGVQQLQSLLLPLALLVAIVATAGSLYYSELAGYPPCKLCWYQRICMYPIVSILGIALWRHKNLGGLYALPSAVIGLGISVYHYQLQLFPGQSSSHNTLVSCAFQYVDVFGFVSIPFMAGSGFIAIIGLVILSSRRTIESGKVEYEGDQATLV